MKCTECKKNIEYELKYLAYYSNSKAVYWKKCKDCIKKMYEYFLEVV